MITDGQVTQNNVADIKSVIRSAETQVGRKSRRKSPSPSQSSSSSSSEESDSQIDAEREV